MLLWHFVGKSGPIGSYQPALGQNVVNKRSWDVLGITTLSGETSDDQVLTPSTATPIDHTDGAQHMDDLKCGEWRCVGNILFLQEELLLFSFLT